MSEHDDTLLDEDLGDEEYDLGNDEEEALLADDYELERQSSYKGEEETDDVLDLGVTDALDDLDAEDENLEFSSSVTEKPNQNDFYEDVERKEHTSSNYYERDERNNEPYENEPPRKYDEPIAPDPTASNLAKGDLREKLQKSVQKVYVAGNGQGMEDDDCEEARERRNRFQNERTIVSPKMNSNIPDTLENVVTSEPSGLCFRGRGRGRISRGRGGRFQTQNSGNFNPRFGGIRNEANFQNQPQPACRPPLLETRPPFLLNVPNNMQNQQIIYQQANPQMQPFQQHYTPGGPIHGPSHFVENRPQFNPAHFQGQLGPRVMGPRLDYGPRGSGGGGSGGGGGGGGISGSVQGPPYGCPANQQQPPYVSMQGGPFPGSGIMQEGQPRLMQSNQQAPLLQGNPGGSLLGNPSALLPGNPTPLLQGNQQLPIQGFPRQQSNAQGLPPISHPNVQIPSHSQFEGRPSFQGSQFEARPVYDSRPGYTEQPAGSQFNNSGGALSLPPQQSGSNVPNVPLPPGHKILINPHFRGAVQSTNDARLVWDSAQQQQQQQQQPPMSSQMPAGQFSQSMSSYQNQGSYGQTQQGPPHYQQNYQQNKSDDPYAYFSDVWQENKHQRTQGSSPSKPYPSESNYSRESSYECSNKYKSDSQWEQKDNYQEDHRGVHQNYRDSRDLPPKPRSDYAPKPRSLSSSAYREDPHEQNHSQRSPGIRSNNQSMRGVSRLPQKRVSDSMDRPLRDLSPKRIKAANNRNLQEVRTVDTLNEPPSSEKKETFQDEDSDPEMQEYRKKMEEQKRLREKILREKENRRKMAAMEKQNEETKNEPNSASNENSQQDTKPVSVLMGVVKEAVANKTHPGVGRGRGRPVGTQGTETNERSAVRIVRTIQMLQPNDSTNDTSKEASTGNLTGQLPAQTATRRVVLQKSLSNSQKIATSIQKTVSNLQKGQVPPQNKVTGNGQNSPQKSAQNQAVTNVKKITTIGQKGVGNGQRVVALKTTGGLQKTVINVQEVTNANAQKVVVNTQNNQRVVLQKAPVQKKVVQEIKTNTVKLENLAASTSEAQIRRMCQGIGTIDSIQMGERSATIVFKTQSAALIFHKKYQRKMLDLSLITVRLIPQSTSNNKGTSGSVAKVS